MRAAEFFAAAERLPVVELPDLLGDGGLVVVAPHPDDESLGCGGLIARAREAGRPVRVVVVTDGTGSHPHSRAWPAPRLRALREAEALAATAQLGVAPADVWFLRLPDRAAPREGPLAALAGAAVARAARACDAGAVLVTWAHDPHGDHAAANALVEAARGALGRAEVLAYSVWGWTLPADQEVGVAPAGARLDVSRQRARKRRAIAAHRSQVSALIDDDPDGFRLPPAMIEACLGPFETFFRASR